MSQLRSTQIKDNVMPNNSQVKIKQKEVEDHHRISYVTECNESLKSRTSNVKAVGATCGKYVFNSNHDDCISKFINDINAKTKKPKVVHISTRKPKRNANQSVATHHKKIVASESTIQIYKSYFRMLYENTSKEKRSTFKTTTVPSSKGRLHLLHMDLCGPMRIESINGKNYILVIVDDYSRYTWTNNAFIIHILGGVIVYIIIISRELSILNSMKYVQVHLKIVQAQKFLKYKCLYLMEIKLEDNKE
ncbi:retrovirus-related pol polyprotein from transposon TNT 1-94 [Tanacetum coccineum]